MLTQREGHFLVQGRLRTDTVQPIDFYEGPSERYGMERGLSPGWPLDLAAVTHNLKCPYTLPLVHNAP